MARKRNRHKNINSYGTKKRQQGADYYGSWERGKQLKPDVINGVSHTWPVRKENVDTDTE